MTVLAAAATARFGNLRYEHQVTSVSADLGLLPAVNRVTVVLPRAVPVDAAPGDPAEISLDGGDGSAAVLTGTVGMIRRTATASVLTAVDAGALLARLRPAATFDGQSVADVVRKLAGDAGAPIGTLTAPLRLAAYVAHQQRTGAEHVAELARLGGALALVDADGGVSVVPRPPGTPDRALLFGREFTSYRVDDLPAGPQVVVVGNGPAGFVPAPDAFLHTSAPLTAGGADPGPSVVWEPEPALRLPAAVEGAAKEANAARAAGAQRLVADCWLLPAVRPGQLLEVQGLPGRLPAGPWLVTSVVHTLDARAGGATRLRAVVGGDALGSLLGAALGALGSVL
ncbi:MAG TPA: hypothetical protein VM942_05735 [Acidimicrobiales bacterium]|nr:hypothetical protein [Acidimicrobiales bacterium]